MYRALRTVLFLLPAETAHHLVIWALGWLSRWMALCRALRRRALASVGPALACEVAGLRSEHPIWLAAGLDKDAAAVNGLFALGFGAVEVGTVTPRPQPGNPTPRVFRLPAQRALINRMGFNNKGAQAAAARLRARAWRPAPLGVNLGKNKDTPLEQAVDDYVRGVEALGALADYVVVNASSPNTPGLRQLQDPEPLAALLRAVKAKLAAVAPGTPLFLKIAPDLSPTAVDDAVDVAIACQTSGLIATNTTLARPFEHPLAKEAGGLSGAPLKDASTEVIRRAYLRAQGRLPIIGVGGIFTAEDAYAKLRAGAAAVQVYTGFIYEGPAIVARMAAGLSALLARDGFRSVADVVGVDASTRP